MDGEQRQRRVLELAALQFRQRLQQRVIDFLRQMIYYRRVVENHKNQILDEIIRVSKKIGAPPETLTALEAAKKEIQFSKALTSVKDAVPQALLINGQNPLTLLHSALSVGLHEQTDETCLALAHDVRVVLIELAERLSQALKDEAELNAAISRLMNVKQEK
jgi:hypothetical protein